MSLAHKLPLYLKLMRFDRPIGTWLLLGHTLWALWFAAGGFPHFSTLIIFICGVILMRAAGCVINDYFDRNFDQHVERTRARPLASGALSKKEALILFLVLMTLAFGLVCLTNLLTMELSFIGALLATIYPLMKRVTYFPQFFFGLAWSWSVPLAFAAETGQVPKIAWLIYIAVISWGMAYDTIYALCDIKDDLKIGVKSTAMFAGRYVAYFIGFFQILTLGLLGVIGVFTHQPMFYFVCLIAVIPQFIFQQVLIKSRDPVRCLRAFKQNAWVGLTVLLGLIISV